MIDAAYLQDAMGRIDETWVDEVMEACPITPSVTRRAWPRRVATVAACLCLAVGLGAGGMHLLYRLGQSQTKADEVESIATSIDVDGMIWLDPSLDTVQEKPDVSAELTSRPEPPKYHGWSVSATLHDALKQADASSRFAILVSPILHGNETFEAYQYQGRTRKEWEAYREECFREQEKRLMLLKDGDALKYGEALYTTGTPEGERWSKTLYDERVAYYGEDFLARYIRNGELLRETLEREAAKYLAEYESIAYILSDLVAAYRAEKAHEAAAVLTTEYGLLCEVRRDRLFLFATARQLKGINGIEKDDFTLSQASRRMYDASLDAFLHLDTTVTGFNTDKLSITTDYIRPRVMQSDADVIEALRFLYDLHQYAEDSYLDVSISAGASVTDEDVARLGGEVTYRAKYFDNISVHVAFERLDLQALRDLSRRADVEYIHIGPPLVADNAG